MVACGNWMPLDIRVYKATGVKEQIPLKELHGGLCVPSMSQWMQAISISLRWVWSLSSEFGQCSNETAFVDGSCSYCKNMPIRMLQFFFKKPQVSSAASHPSPSTSRYDASVASTKGDQGVIMTELLLGKSPQASHSPTCSVPLDEKLTSSISHSGLVGMMSCQSQHRREGLSSDVNDFHLQVWQNSLRLMQSWQPC